jgi:hypothetical protein
MTTAFLVFNKPVPIDFLLQTISFLSKNQKFELTESN